MRLTDRQACSDPVMIFYDTQHTYLTTIQEDCDRKSLLSLTEKLLCGFTACGSQTNQSGLFLSGSRKPVVTATQDVVLWYLHRWNVTSKKSTLWPSRMFYYWVNEEQNPFMTKRPSSLLYLIFNLNDVCLILSPFPSACINVFERMLSVMDDMKSLGQSCCQRWLIAN